MPSKSLTFINKQGNLFTAFNQKISKATANKIHAEFCASVHNNALLKLRRCRRQVFHHCSCLVEYGVSIDMTFRSRPLWNVTISKTTAPVSTWSQRRATNEKSAELYDCWKSFETVGSCELSGMFNAAQLIILKATKFYITIEKLGRILVSSNSLFFLVCVYIDSILDQNNLMLFVIFTRIFAQTKEREKKTARWQA